MPIYLNLPPRGGSIGDPQSAGSECYFGDAKNDVHLIQPLKTLAGSSLAQETQQDWRTRCALPLNQGHGHQPDREDYLPAIAKKLLTGRTFNAMFIEYPSIQFVEGTSFERA